MILPKLFLAAAVSALALGTSPWAQTTIHVPADQPTIQDAIAVAVNGDTVLVAPGTYLEQIDFLGKAILVATSGGSGATTIERGLTSWPDQGPGYDATVRFDEGESGGSMLRGFTILSFDGFAEPAIIWSVGAYPTVIDCVIDGRGIAQGVRGDGTFIECLFDRCVTGNGSPSVGGAVEGDGTFVGCRFNKCFGFAGGGAIKGDPTVVQCEFLLNYVGYGNGGAIEASGSAIVLDSYFYGNASGVDVYHGGAIYGAGPVSGSVFVANKTHGPVMSSPSFGGALAFSGPIDRCTILNNEVDGSPGCEIDIGYGVLCDGGGVFGCSVKNSILRGNGPNQAGSSTVTYSNVEGGHAGVGNFDDDPGFIDEAGGDYRLRADSSSIGAGQLGWSDIGAYDFSPTLWSPTESISASAGGSQVFEVHAGTQQAGDLYWILGSASGTQPGIVLEGSLLLPLVPDSWLTFTVNAANSPTLPNSAQVVPASGLAASALILPAGLDPTLVGLTLHHAFVTADTGPWSPGPTATSDALAVTITP